MKITPHLSIQFRISRFALLRGSDDVIRNKCKTISVALKKLLSYIFLFLYVANQAAIALPVFNSNEAGIYYKKKCKYGRQDKLIKMQIGSQQSESTFSQEDSQRIITFCVPDIHIVQDILWAEFPDAGSSPETYFIINHYLCYSSIETPPPCLA